ncbi:MAG: CPBP family intramembrane metalloprotease [bacterium]|nr:CPBP family intramembrane metalloprotease [bacterium]
MLVWYLGNAMPAPVAWVAAVALFGWGHFCQGRKGMIQTAMVGALMLALYVISGTLWVSMVLHVVIDVNSGLFGAWVVGRAEAEEPESRPAAPAAGQ